ncbi:PAS domain-containing protein [Halonotius sp. GCM10025705]|uniref:PAS domain-containing protein n=1 Tax=Halonotius sp. GCM10025705 TaxID=3252678 RepID=UPI003612283E
MTAYPRTDGTNRFERLFNELNEAVVEFKLVDGDPVIVQANGTFADTFGHGTESLSGVSLNDLIVPTDRREEAKQFDQQTAAGESNAAVVERVTANGRRQFVYRSVPIREGHGFAIYTDVTAELRRERHLDVLQRVLRHNLRNDVNVIAGQAEKISELPTPRRYRQPPTQSATPQAGWPDSARRPKPSSGCSESHQRWSQPILRPSSIGSSRPATRNSQPPRLRPTARQPCSLPPTPASEYSSKASLTTRFDTTRPPNRT